MSNKWLRTVIVTLMILALLVVMVINRLRSHTPARPAMVPGLVVRTSACR